MGMYEILSASVNPDQKGQYGYSSQYCFELTYSVTLSMIVCPQGVCTILCFLAFVWGLGCVLLPHFCHAIQFTSSKGVYISTYIY